MSYNINGLKNKILFHDFYEFVKSHDIFCLLETHIEEESFENYKKYFAGFDLCFKKATRISQYGRAIGGEIHGVKKDLRNAGITYAFEQINDLKIIKIKTRNIALEIIPLYLNCNNWQNDFKTLTEYFVEQNTTNTILIGDLNIRIGSIQQNIEEIFAEEFKANAGYRKSKDKLINGRGKKFIELCNDYGQIVLNGRTKGDDEGNITYIKGNGSAVNDICSVSQELLGNVSSFTIEGKIWSDHMPLTLELKVSCTNRNSCKKNLLPMFKWEAKAKSQYNEKLTRNVGAILRDKSHLEMKDITDIIIASIPKIERNKKLFSKKSKWYNYKCYAAKKKSQSLLNKYRKSESMSNRENYLKANKRYKSICEQSKKSYYNNIEAQVNTVKNGKEWWKLVKELRNRSPEQEVSISAEDFKKYFEKLLNPTQTAKEIHYAANLVEIEDLDKPISPAEIVQTLQKAKEGKAPGLDRIPYEFYKNANLVFLDQLAKVYTYMYNAGEIDESFQTSIIFPIHKKGDTSIVSNFRGVAFMNTKAKILMGVLNERLTNWVEENNILSEYQAGFRKNYSTNDNLYNLTAIVHLKFDENKKVYALFIDFKAAFDKIPRSLLMYKLRSIGVSSKFVDFIEKIYIGESGAK